MSAQTIALAEGAAQRPRLLDRVREMALARFGRPEPGDRFAEWARRFILFHGKRHPGDLGLRDIGQFLEHFTPRAAEIKTMGRPRSSGSVSWPPENSTGMFLPRPPHARASVTSPTMQAPGNFRHQFTVFPHERASRRFRWKVQPIIVSLRLRRSRTAGFASKLRHGGIPATSHGGPQMETSPHSWRNSAWKHALITPSTAGN